MHDVVIIVAGHPYSEAYWEKKLRENQTGLLEQNTEVITVTEDWPGGAGNGLGSLYAFQQAYEKGLKRGLDLRKKLRQGASIALFHSAGYGKRLWPLVGSENNCKGAIKLPTLTENRQPLRLLEAVIHQTGTRLPKREGRLAVYWGDQLFLPSNHHFPQTSYAIDILGQSIPFNGKESWNHYRCELYGLLVTDSSGTTRLLDKVNYDYLEGYIQKHQIDPLKGIALSLGCFTLSASMLDALIEEFSKELCSKTGKLDSDAHFWMPYHLTKIEYVTLMETKGWTPTAAEIHYDRMRAFFQRFQNGPLFGMIDIGANSQWWDFGNVKAFYENGLKLISGTAEAKAFCEYLKLNPEKVVIDTDNNSIFINCKIASGKVRNSVLVGVEAEKVDIKNSLILFSTLKELEGSELLLYNVKESKNLWLSSGVVRADVDFGDHSVPLYTTLERSGKDDWDCKLPSNAYSYAQVHTQLKSLAYT